MMGHPAMPVTDTSPFTCPCHLNGSWGLDIISGKAQNSQDTTGIQTRIFQEKVQLCNHNSILIAPSFSHLPGLAHLCWYLWIVTLPLAVCHPKQPFPHWAVQASTCSWGSAAVWGDETLVPAPIGHPNRKPFIARSYHQCSGCP